MGLISRVSSRTYRFTVSMAQILQKLGGVAAVGTGLAFMVGNDCYYTVDPGHRAVMFNRVGGVSQSVTSEGLHFKLPWFQWPLNYDIRQRPHTITSPSGSKDLQTVNLSLRTITHPIPSSLPKIVKMIGPDFDAKVLPSLTNETLKSVVAQYKAQRASFIVEQAKQERQQKIVTAEGEAQAASLIGEACSKNPAYLKLMKISVAKEISKTMSRSGNRMFLDNDQLMLNVFDDKYAAVNK